MNNGQRTPQASEADDEGGREKSPAQGLMAPVIGLNAGLKKTHWIRVVVSIDTTSRGVRKMRAQTKRGRHDRVVPIAPESDGTR